MWNRRLGGAAVMRLARFFHSPVRLAAAIAGVLSIGVGAAVSGIWGGLLATLGVAALLATLANPVQFLWERAAADMEKREGEGSQLDPLTRIRRTEAAVNLLASWCGRLERESESRLDGAIEGMSIRVEDLASRFKAIELRDEDRAEAIENLFGAVRSVIATQSELAHRLTEREQQEFSETRKLAARLSAEASKIEARAAAIEAKQMRDRRNDNAIHAQLADLTEAIRSIRSELGGLVNQPEDAASSSQATLSLLEQRVSALATNFERAALNRGGWRRLDG